MCVCVCAWAPPVSVQGEVLLSGRCCGAPTLLPAALPPPPLPLLLLLLSVLAVSRGELPPLLLFTQLPALLCSGKKKNGLSSSVTLARPANGQHSDREEP